MKALQPVAEEELANLVDNTTTLRKAQADLESASQTHNSSMIEWEAKKELRHRAVEEYNRITEKREILVDQKTEAIMTLNSAQSGHSFALVMAKSAFMEVGTAQDDVTAAFV